MQTYNISILKCLFVLWKVKANDDISSPLQSVLANIDGWPSAECLEHRVDDGMTTFDDLDSFLLSPNSRLAIEAANELQCDLPYLFDLSFVPPSIAQSLLPSNGSVTNADGQETAWQYCVTNLNMPTLCMCVCGAIWSLMLNWYGGCVMVVLGCAVFDCVVSCYWLYWIVLVGTMHSCLCSLLWRNCYML